jgi:rSAM/selenodomain-associated transferase 1
MKDTTLIIFGKYPREGFVKTRLAASVGNALATEFFRHCIENIFDVADGIRQHMEPVFCFAEAQDESSVRDWLGNRFRLIPQMQASLMDRNREAFRHVFEEGTKSALIIATDIPDISSNVLLEAQEALATYDVVIGPDQVDGYYLLGMNGFEPRLFDIAYGAQTPLFPQLLEQAEVLNLRVRTLPVLLNINTIEDLNQWQENERINKKDYSTKRQVVSVPRF